MGVMISRIDTCASIVTENFNKSFYYSQADYVLQSNASE